ncbi:MAG: PAS domain S-box protein [Acidobacteriota bacterium]
MSPKPTTQPRLDRAATEGDGHEDPLEELSRDELMALARRQQEQLSSVLVPERAPQLGRSEEALRLSRFAIDNVAESMFTVAEDGRILDVNATACRRLEYTVDELCGMTVFDFDEQFPPEVWPGFWRELETNGSMIFDSVHRSKSGQLFPVEITASHFEFEGAAYACSFVRDVSERKQAEKRLRLTRFAVDQSQEAIFTVSAEGRILDVNDTACSRLGYSREELQEMGTAGFDLRYRPEIWPGHFEKIKRLGSMLIESTHRTREGRVFPVEIHEVYFEFEGEDYCVSSVIDISERKRVEENRAAFREALREKNLALQAQNEELEVTNAEMERFVYTVSHDLKSPLVTIKGFIGLLARDAAAGNIERLQHDLERISIAADKMYRLLEELLELSRVGRVVNAMERVPVGDLVNEALELQSSQLEKKQVEVVVEPELPDMWCDRVRLQEVVQNLIENAVKFLGSQPAPRLEIGAEQQAESTVCYVRDNGIGIEAKYQDKVFGLFERLDQTIDGTGVGLALVRRIIEVHGGRVWIESEGKDQGTTVYFSLPRTP